jgi:hypothetical protein
MPTLLRTRPLPLQLVLAVLVPIAFGAICGWLLGVNEIAYLIASVLAIAGGYVAGQEHMGAVEGAIRGLVGGALFGGAILLVHNATGEPAKAKLPDPEILLVAITVVAGIVLGALGGRRRAKREEEDEEEEEGTGFDLKRVKRSELLGFLGAAILAFALFFLPWFSTSCTSTTHTAGSKVVGHPTGCNPNSKLELANKLDNGDPHYVYGSYTGWEVYRFMRWLLLAACIAPFLLAYIIARGHELSWRTGEVTMIVGILAFALILVDGIILGRPGSNKGFGVDINIEYGYLVGLLGAFLISLGGFRRQAENVKPQPPGI